MTNSCSSPFRPARVRAAVVLPSGFEDVVRVAAPAAVRFFQQPARFPAAVPCPVSECGCSEVLFAFGAAPTCSACGFGLAALGEFDRARVSAVLGLQEGSR